MNTLQREPANLKQTQEPFDTYFRTKFQELNNYEQKKKLFLDFLSEKFQSNMTNETTPEPRKEENQEIIKLNVGGKLFVTTRTTIFSVENSLKAMLQSGAFKPDLEGAYFIDRSPEYFPIILDYLRNPTKDLKLMTSHLTERRKQQDFQCELDFYCIAIEQQENVIPIDTVSSLMKLKDSTLTKEKGNYGYAFSSRKLLSMEQEFVEFSFEFLQVPLGGKVSIFVGLTKEEEFGSVLATVKTPKIKIEKASKGDCYTFVFDLKSFVMIGYFNQEEFQRVEFENSSEWIPCIEMDCAKQEKISVLLK
jgi:hypothetical protein